jgi:hypothetical protein
MVDTTHEVAETTEEPKKRKARGPGKRPAMFCTSLRLPKYVVEYFDTYHPYNKQASMREVLIEYVEIQLQNKGATDEPQN